MALSSIVPEANSELAFVDVRLLRHQREHFLWKDGAHEKSVVLLALGGEPRGKGVYLKGEN